MDLHQIPHNFPRYPHRLGQKLKERYNLTTAEIEKSMLSKYGFELTRLFTIQHVASELLQFLRSQNIQHD